MMLLSNQAVLNNIANFRTMITKMNKKIAADQCDLASIAQFLSEADFLSEQMELQIIHMDTLYNSLAASVE